MESKGQRATGRATTTGHFRWLTGSVNTITAHPPCPSVSGAENAVIAVMADGRRTGRRFARTCLLALIYTVLSVLAVVWSTVWIGGLRPAVNLVFLPRKTKDSN
ncbi:uncharacterized protein LOC101003906 [Anopheles sinensis]|uniref:Uncharacterized protein LOC101003906 n=1 Tax=Anopheles sinensis TaxID=74873 RepID=A0A084VR38_ANOSI|nr:uncharacterized protein LOC101003906 [Anopheles sinensis]